MSELLQKNAGAIAGTSTPIQSTKLILDNDYTTQAIDIIKAAKVEIRLCAYAWRWYENEPEIGIQKFNIELLRAKQRGVIVRCLVDTDAIRARFSALGFNCRAVANNKMLHTKALCVDHKTLVVGSHNLTKRANTDNYEISVMTQDFEPLEQFITYFDAMWRSRG